MARAIAGPISVQPSSRLIAGTDPTFTTLRTMPRIVGSMYSKNPKIQNHSDGATRCVEKQRVGNHDRPPLHSVNRRRFRSARYSISAVRVSAPRAADSLPHAFYEQTAA